MPVLPFPVVGRCCNRLGAVFSSSAWSKTPALPLQFWLSLSYFRGYKYFRLVRQCRIYLWTLSFSFSWSRTLLLLLESQEYVSSRHLTVWVITNVKFSQFQNNSCLTICQITSIWLLQFVPIYIRENWWRKNRAGAVFPPKRALLGLIGVWKSNSICVRQCLIGLNE